jgi:uncharacterized protein YkwD
MRLLARVARAGFSTLAASIALALILQAGFAAHAADEPAEDSERVLRELLEAHNAERAKAKLPPLTANPKLAAAALAHATDMAATSTLSHEGTDGSTPVVRIERERYRYRSAGENVARGQRGVAAVMTTWMESPEHKKNILGDFQEMGAAVVSDKTGARFWCVDFGTAYADLKPAEAEQQMIAALNRARAKEQLPPLRANSRLRKAAEQVVKRVVELEKVEPRKRKAPNFVDDVRRAGYRYQRIVATSASGESDANELVRAWLDRPDHRPNVVGDYVDVGVGYATSPEGRPCWCVLFAAPRG